MTGIKYQRDQLSHWNPVILMQNAMRPDISILVEQQSKLLISNNFVSQETISCGRPPAAKAALGMVAKQKGRVRQITDQDFLVQIATSKRAISLCEAAALMITDQERLITVNRSSKSGSVRAAAVLGIKDQRLLAMFMLEDQNHLVVDAACKGIKDQACMANYLRQAQNGPREDFRKRIVLDNLNDQSHLKDLASDDIVIANANALSTILSKIKDEEFVKRVIREKLKLQPNALNSNALSNVLDQQFLKDLAGSESVPFRLRKTAASKVNDEKFIALLLLRQMNTGELWNTPRLRLPHNLSDKERDECGFAQLLIGKTNDGAILNGLRLNMQTMLLLGGAINSRIREISADSSSLTKLVRN